KNFRELSRPGTTDRAPSTRSFSDVTTRTGRTLCLILRNFQALRACWMPPCCVAQRRQIAACGTRLVDHQDDGRLLRRRCHVRAAFPALGRRAAATRALAPHPGTRCCRALGFRCLLRLTEEQAKAETTPGDRLRSGEPYEVFLG